MLRATLGSSGSKLVGTAAGCASAERLSSAKQEHQRSLNRQATVRIQAEAAEELAHLEQASSQDLGAPRPLRIVIVTTGAFSQPYEVLGEVHVNTRGMINFGSALNDALFRSPLAVAIGGRTPVAHTEQMNELLKEQARKQYGARVDAIINATYKDRETKPWPHRGATEALLSWRGAVRNEALSVFGQRGLRSTRHDALTLGHARGVLSHSPNTDHDGDVFASGLAVHFIEQKPPQMQQAAPPERHLEDRLKELRDLREKGLISTEEYNQKRQELIQGL